MVGEERILRVPPAPPPLLCAAFTAQPGSATAAYCRAVGQKLILLVLHLSLRVPHSRRSHTEPKSDLANPADLRHLRERVQAPACVDGLHRRRRVPGAAQSEAEAARLPEGLRTDI